MNTYILRKKNIKRQWHLIDAKGQVLGRLTSQIAMKLTGKTKVDYTPNIDNGDYIVVINAKDVKVTGNKEKQKVYRSHSGYPGGFKEIKYAKMKLENPARIIQLAVWGMLPDNRLRDGRMARLKVFVADKHPYTDKFDV